MVTDYSKITPNNEENPYGECDRWEFITGDREWDEYSGNWITRKPLSYELADEEFIDVYFVRELYIIDIYNEGEPEFLVNIYAVCLDLLADKDVKSVASSYGWKDYEDELPLKSKLVDLANYGLAANLYNQISKDIDGYQELFKESDEIIDEIIDNDELGYYLILPQN